MDPDERSCIESLYGKLIESLKVDRAGFQTREMREMWGHSPLEGVMKAYDTWEKDQDTGTIIALLSRESEEVNQYIGVKNLLIYYNIIREGFGYIYHRSMQDLLGQDRIESAKKAFEERNGFRGYMYIDHDANYIDVNEDLERRLGQYLVPQEIPKTAPISSCRLIDTAKEYVAIICSFLGLKS
ncbi:MAG: hypothetical protein HGA85_02915 [Nanoarchaeota archaeon]|nr:hypothetical protein [Nanoarchaeota archaeon]